MMTDVAGFVWKWAQYIGGGLLIGTLLIDGVKLLAGLVQLGVKTAELALNQADAADKPIKR